MTLYSMKTWLVLTAILALSVMSIACKDDGPSGACYDTCSLAADCDLLDPGESLADCNESCDFIQELNSEPGYQDCADALDTAFACSSSLSCEQAEELSTCDDDEMCDGEGVPCYDEVSTAEFICSSADD
jgi:hypothetical protein